MCSVHCPLEMNRPYLNFFPLSGSVVGRPSSFHTLSLQREIRGSCTSVAFDDDMVREMAHFLLPDAPQPGYWVQRAA